MPDPAFTASLAAPGIAPTSALPVDPVRLPNRYEVREELWGIHKRFVVSDTATNTTIAIRATSQSADSDLIRLNWAARVRPDPGTARQPAGTPRPEPQSSRDRPAPPAPGHLLR